jgi:hypothetical protein
MTVSSDDAVLYSAAIAGELLGTADSSDAGHLRYGSISINLHKGTFFDTDVDEGGTLFDLVRQRKGFENGELETWIEEVKARENRRRAEMAMDRELPDLDDDLRCISAERALIGRILVSRNTLDLVIEEITSTDFAFEAHREVYMAMVDAHSRDQPLTLPQLIVALGGDDGSEVVPGFTITTYLARLFADAPANFDAVARDTAIMLRGLTEERQQGPLPLFNSKFGAKPFEEIGVGKNEFYPYTIEDIIPEGEAVLLYGDTGTGKSFDAFDMAMSVSRDLKFNGYNVQAGLTVYIAAEAGKGFEKRKFAYAMHHNISQTQRLPFVLLTKKVNFFRDDADAEGLIKELRDIQDLYDVPLRMIFIDTLSATTPGMNENASYDIGPVKARIDRVRVAIGAAVILVHHKPKGGLLPRGHTSLTADFETTIEFATSDLHDQDGLKIHIATVRKQREGKAGLSWKFTLPQIEVGKNRWGNPETTCVVRPIGADKVDTAGAANKGFRATDGEAAFYKALLTALGEHGQKPPEGCAAPRGVELVVHYDRVKEIFKKQNLTEEIDQRSEAERLKKALQRARSSLARYECIGADNPWVWRTEKWIRGFPRHGSDIVKQYDTEQAAQPSVNQPEFEEF